MSHTEERPALSNLNSLRAANSVKKGALGATGLKICSLRHMIPLICMMMIAGCAPSDEDDYESDSSTEIGSSEDGEEPAARYGLPAMTGPVA